MKTRDRLNAIDSSSADWQEGVPELSIQDVTLMRLIRVASQGITAFTDPLLQSSGLTESSYHTLIIILASGTQGVTPTSLCDLVGQKRSNMTRIIDVLVSEGLVKIKTDVRDARRRRINILPAGRKLVRACGQRYQSVTSTVFNSLDAENKETLERLLRTVIASMDIAEQMAVKLR
ncbi:MarR family winged helix-turn-helix transcriptional regulator [Zhongshania sp.]|uniref:MarR family winged helix-turn-helix transcriptional regulator n=1 Tax=Zhongshania sp. TaxID=1971902 RepID=UPI002A7F1D97|nr:MarR family winged helix-turn-helix transcriptional regulator [Zhongshania sp.]